MKGQHNIREKIYAQQLYVDTWVEPMWDQPHGPPPSAYKGGQQLHRASCACPFPVFQASFKGFVLYVTLCDFIYRYWNWILKNPLKSKSQKPKKESISKEKKKRSKESKKKARNLRTYGVPEQQQRNKSRYSAKERGRWRSILLNGGMGNFVDHLLCCREYISYEISLMQEETI